MGRRKRSTGRINLCTYLYYYVLYYYMASANNANGESLRLQDENTVHRVQRKMGGVDRSRGGKCGALPYIGHSHPAHVGRCEMRKIGTGRTAATAKRASIKTDREGLN